MIFGKKRKFVHHITSYPALHSCKHNCIMFVHTSLFIAKRRQVCISIAHLCWQLCIAIGADGGLDDCAPVAPLLVCASTNPNIATTAIIAARISPVLLSPFLFIISPLLSDYRCKTVLVYIYTVWGVCFFWIPEKCMCDSTSSDN